MGQVTSAPAPRRGGGGKGGAKPSLFRLWDVTVAMWVPTEDVGSVIGARGRHIMAIQHECGLRVHIPVGAPDVASPK